MDGKDREGRARRELSVIDSVADDEERDARSASLRENEQDGQETGTRDAGISQESDGDGATPEDKATLSGILGSEKIRGQPRDA